MRACVIGLAVTLLLPVNVALAQGAPFCVVTAAGAECLYYDANSCRQAARAMGGMCAINRGVQDAPPGCTGTGCIGEALSHSSKGLVEGAQEYQMRELLIEQQRMRNELLRQQLERQRQLEVERLPSCSAVPFARPGEVVYCK